MCSKVGLLISWDDNDSLKNEELVGVVHFDGALVGTKKDGVQEMVSLYCNENFTALSMLVLFNCMNGVIH